MRVLPMGPVAVLLDDLDAGDRAGCAPAMFAVALRNRLGADVVDVVPAARTVLVTCPDSDALARVLDRLDEIGPLDAAGAATATAPIEIPVRYDGDDLESVAERAGLTIAAVIAAHVSATYSVAFCGFAPGFAYLAGLDPALHLPRRVAPRTRVPAGSVAVAAEYSAVYPTASPGGWHLLGRTDLAMFDPARTPAVLLEPGCTVRFVAV